MTKQNKNELYCIIVKDNSWDDEELNGYQELYFKGKEAFDLALSFINDCCNLTTVISYNKVNKPRALDCKEAETLKQVENHIREELEFGDEDNKIKDMIAKSKKYAMYHRYLPKYYGVAKTKPEDLLKDFTSNKENTCEITEKIVNKLGNQIALNLAECILSKLGEDGEIIWKVYNKHDISNACGKNKITRDDMEECQACLDDYNPAEYL